MGLDAQFARPSRVSWPERLVKVTGKAAAWLCLAMVLLSFLIVVLRYGFNLGWIGMQEAVTYLHAMVFMLAAAWALQMDEHVRVDIFYRQRSDRHKAMIDIFGTILLLIPFCLFMLMSSWNYVEVAWSTREGSREAGGLPYVYALKTLILILPALLLVQAGCDLYCRTRLLLQR